MRAVRVAVIGVLLGTWGCWVPNETGAAMQRDIHTLQGQVSAADKSLAEQRARLDEQVQQAGRKTEEVARTLDELNRAARSTDADFGVQLERLIKEVQELRGSIELTEYRLGKIEAKLEGPGSLTERIAALEKAQASAPAATATPPPATTDKEPPKGKKELLAYGAQLVKGGKAGDARGVYRDVIKQWPSEAGVTDEAYFRIGETYYDEKKCRSALSEYIKVVDKFASGALADDAYYKIGLCSIDIGNLEDAKIFFTEIVRSHKKSPLAKDAQKKLDEVEARLEKEAKAKSKGKGK